MHRMVCSRPTSTAVFAIGSLGPEEESSAFVSFPLYTLEQPVLHVQVHKVMVYCFGTGCAALQSVAFTMWQMLNQQKELELQP